MDWLGAGWGFHSNAPPSELWFLHAHRTAGVKGKLSGLNHHATHALSAGWTAADGSDTGHRETGIGTGNRTKYM
jgi:hypothetical protein